MSLLSPLFLVLLGLAAVIVALHIRRRRSVTVPSVQIWRRLQGTESQSVRRLELPRPNLLMLLQIAALAAIAAALAQPLFSNAPRADHLMILVDGSGDMRVPENGRTRFDLALEAAAGLAADGRAERVSVIQVDADPRVVIARQLSDAEEMERSIGAMRPGDGQADWDAATVHLSRLARPDETSRLVYLSHRPLPEQSAAAVPGAEVDYRRIGSGQGDITFTAQLSEVDAAGGDWLVTGAAVFSGEIEIGRLSVSFTPVGGGSALNVANLGIEAPRSGASAAGPVRSEDFRLALDLPGPGLLELAVTGDALQHARRTWFEIRDAERTLDVLYLGGGRQPFIQALQSVAGVRVFQANALPVDLSQFALVVVDGVSVSRAPETNTLWIAGGRVDDDVSPGMLETDAPDNWRIDHPLTSGIAWANLVVSGATAIAPPEDAAVLLESEDAPLLAARSGRHGREIWLAFDPAASNWPSHAGFPIFARNLVDWLGQPPTGGRVGPRCTVGLSCAVDARLIGGTITLLAEGLAATGGPAGGPGDAAERPPAGPITTGAIHLRESGLYRLEHNGLSELLVAAPPAATGGGPFQDATDQSQAAGIFSWTLWPWLAALALVVLIAEGLIAGRGTERFLHRSALSASNPLSHRRRWLLGLRIATLGCVVLGLVNLPLVWPTLRSNVVMVLSPPAAPERDDPATTALDRAMGEAEALLADRRLGAVVRGAWDRGVDGLGEAAPRAARENALSADLIESLDLALAVIPQGEPGRIVLADEGGLTSEEVARIGARLGARDIVLDLIPMRAPPDDEVVVRGLDAPAPLFAGDSFPLATRIFSASATSAEVTVRYNGEIVEQNRVDLRAGHNRLDTIIRDIGLQPGFLDVAVDSDAEERGDNNSGGLWVAPRGPGTVAILTHQSEQGRSLAQLLVDEGFNVDVIRPDFAPFQLSNWLNYQLVVLLNVASSELARQQQDILETAVSEHGMGLLILGGENAFGPGGYLETTLEQMSPLSSRIPREAPEAALVFVLDRSGSMQQRVGNATRLDVAKRATTAAVQLLNEQSRVGIVAFDAEAEIVMPLEIVGDGSAVSAALERFDAGGGTSIHPGLVLARDLLSGDEASIRHVIVMTDGMSQPGDFAGVLGDLRASETSVSAVAIAVGPGQGRDTVRTIANLGGGSFHASDDFEALPSILVQEAMLLSGSPIELGSSEPRWTSGRAAFLMGLPDRMPSIEGFVLTSSKPEANLLMVTPDGEGAEMPLLASWQYGNGSVLALTTSPTGAWTRQWQSLPEYGQLWSQIVRHFLSGGTAPGLELAAVRQADRVFVELQASGETGQPVTGLRPVTTVGGDLPGFEALFTLAEVSPGLYQATFLPPQPGDYRVSVDVPEMGEAETRIHVAHPRRYDFDPSNPALATMAQQTGGRILSEDQAIFPAPELRWRIAGGWPVWLLAGLALFMADLVLRYASPANRITRFLAPLRTGRPKTADPSSAAPRREAKQMEHV